ncbi:MAG: hypothetical protein KGH59_02850 [Candidatus Micrarchaeota archaeon]|nr:hypothetical protein [Candidatus Micrarchaeota archaeon]MDE1804695.1 hypothetical protein [Candidatus Micrarchaeota archaeon]MDE1846803.1 hypothetical protein [Candidatus Micrarchaeota archaeon]
MAFGIKRSVEAVLAGNSEYDALKPYFSKVFTAKQSLLSVLRGPKQVGPMDSEIEKRAKYEFNVVCGPVFGKPMVMYFISDQLASGERMSFRELVSKMDKKGFPFDVLDTKLALLGGLLVLSEQNFLNKAMENGEHYYSIASPREAEEQLKRLCGEFDKLRRGQTLQEQVLC